MKCITYRLTHAMTAVEMDRMHCRRADAMVPLITVDAALVDTSIGTCMRDHIRPLLALALVALMMVQSCWAVVAAWDRLLFHFVWFFFFICPQTFFHRIAFGKKNVESKMKRENENYISELNMLKVARSSARVSNEKIFIHSLRFEYWLISIGYEVDANAENIMNIVDMQYTTNEK